MCAVEEKGGALCVRAPRPRLQCSKVRRCESSKV
jgi:hypothetical protein